MRLILASASPRRRELLEAAGYQVVVDPVDVDERQWPGEAAEAYVARVARDKARAGLGRHPGATIIGADTSVVIDGDVLGKPMDDADAARMLRRLSGRRHVVLTGVSIVTAGGEANRTERTEVWMSAMTPHDIVWYVASGEPRDKAGGYAIQGLASRFIPRIEGSYSNVVGLPIATVREMLDDLGSRFGVI